MTVPFDGRRLFVHPAHGRIGVSAAVGRPREAPLGGAESWEQSAAARVGFIVGSAEEGWREAAAILLDHLAADGRLAIRPVPRSAGRGCEAAGPWDCLVLLGRPEPGYARWLGLEAYCRQGGALVALGSASRALPDWPAFAEAVLGGRDEGPGRKPLRLEVEPAAEAWHHPVLAGVEPFAACGDPRGPVRLARGAQILLWGFGGGRVKPLAWCWRPRGGGVFYSLLGQLDDFRQADFLRLLANAVGWAADIGPL
jgi:hypothetical protein